MPSDLEGGWYPFPDWRHITVTGSDGKAFLQSQLTADVDGLERHQSCLSALLDRSGRVQSFLFVLRDDHSYRLLVPEELVDITLERLHNHVVADDVELHPDRTGAMVLVLGSTAMLLAAARDPKSVFPLAIYGQRGFVTWSPEPVDLAPLSDQEISARRLLSGFPRLGLDVKAGQLVNETTLVDTAIAHDKGCYLGQETVHKIHSRRGAGFAPMALEPDVTLADPASYAGRKFTVDGARAGTILDWASWGDRVVLQASLHRDLRVEGLEASCLFDDGRSIDVRMRRLPMLEAPSARQTAEHLVARAAKMFTADREREAETLLEHAIAVCPEYPDAYEAFGVALGRREEYERAITLMHQLLEVQPDSVMAHANLSVYFNRLGRIDDAERELRLARTPQQSTPVRVETIMVAPTPGHTEADDEHAIRESMFMQVLAIDPTDSFALFSLGELRFSDGRYQEAVELLNRAITAQPDYAAAYLQLGQVWEEIGDRGQASSVYAAGVGAAAAAGVSAIADAMQERRTALRAAK